MQNVQRDEYVEQLEALIINRLLPGYLQYCKTASVVPVLCEIPEPLVQRVKVKQRLPALFRPF